jgi:hypothetical protein
MNLHDLWQALIEKASEEEKAVAAKFHDEVKALSDKLKEYVPVEFPKWVDGKIVNSPAELQPAAAPAAPAVVDQTPAAPEQPAAPAAEAHQ